MEARDKPHNCLQTGKLEHLSDDLKEVRTSVDKGKTVKVGVVVGIIALVLAGVGSHYKLESSVDVLQVSVDNLKETVTKNEAKEDEREKKHLADIRTEIQNGFRYAFRHMEGSNK